MNYEELENEILTKLNNNDKSCLDTIESNNKAVLTYLKDTEKPIRIREFINKLNLLILSKKEFKLFEKVLKHDLFTKVLYEFRNSDILIDACKIGNKEAISWLLTMDIKNINTALFNAANNNEILDLLLKSDIDINYQNKDGETLLIYCIKNGLDDAVKRVLRKANLDLNRTDNNDRNAVMYLVEEGSLINTEVIKKYVKMKSNDFDVNYRNKNNETLLSILISQFKRIYFSDYNRTQSNKILPYALVLMDLIDMGCDFNLPIDDEGNTALMFFIMVKDYCAVYCILENCKNIDLSIKNKHGYGITELCLTIEEPNNYLKRQLLYNKTFDYYYQDEHYNNILIHLIIRDLTLCFIIACREICSSHHEKVFTQVNDKNENFVIVATKLGYGEHLDSLDCLSYVNINHQDHLGNTALYYAIKIKDKQTINLLAYNHADINIKNNQGVSAFDLSKEMNDESIINILKNPISPKSFKKKNSKSGIKSLFFKEKKNTDEKLNDYVQDYQIKSYRSSYDYTSIEKKYPYPIFEDYKFMKPKLWFIYSNQGRIVFNKSDKYKDGFYIELINTVDEHNDRHIYWDEFYILESHQEFRKCPF